MPENIQSNKCLFQVDLNGTYLNLLCAKSFDVNFDSSLKETTTKGDGNHKDYDYDQKEYSINLALVLFIQDGVNPMALDLLDYYDNQAEINYRAIYYGTGGVNLKSITGQCIVQNLKLSAQPNQLAESTVNLVGKGKPVLADHLPEFITLHLTMTGANAALTKFRLINTDNENVFQTDLLPQANAGELSDNFDITVLVPKGNWYVYWAVNSNTDNNEYHLNAPPAADIVFNAGIFEQNTFGVTLYDFTEDRNVGWTMGIPIPPPACVAPALVAPLTNSSGTTGITYIGNIIVSGSSPKTITNVTKPSWLGISIVDDNIIVLSGTPDAAGDYPVIFDVENACGSLHFELELNIVDPPAPIIVNWTTALEIGTAGVMRIYKNAVEVVNETGNNSGTLICAEGDVLQALVSGILLYKKRIQIGNDVDGALYDVTVTTFTHSHSETVHNGKGEYTFNLTISN